MHSDGGESFDNWEDGNNPEYYGSIEITRQKYLKILNKEGGNQIGETIENINQKVFGFTRDLVQNAKQHFRNQ